MSNLFGPPSPEPELVSPRQAAIAELQAVADAFHRSAVTSANQAISITYTYCAEYVEGRIAALQAGAPVAR